MVPKKTVKKDDYADIKASPLYINTILALPKHHHERLAKELAMVRDSGCYIDFSRKSVDAAFAWVSTPQGSEFWSSFYLWVREYLKRGGNSPSEILMYYDNSGYGCKFITEDEHRQQKAAA